MKIILIGCFSASGKNESLISNLQRKMSSTQDELDINGSDPLDKLNIAEPIPATFTALEQQKEDYKHVVKVLKNAKDIGMSDDLLTQIDKEGFM